MTTVVGRPKDALDRMSEQLRALETMLDSMEPKPAVVEALIHVKAAGTDITLARAAVSRFR